MFDINPDINNSRYEVRLQNGLDCGGAYMKLFPEGFEPESLLDNSRYVIMFGPDKCGSDNKVEISINS